MKKQYVWLIVLALAASFTLGGAAYAEEIAGSEPENPGESYAEAESVADTEPPQVVSGQSEVGYHEQTYNVYADVESNTQETVPENAPVGDEVGGETQSTTTDASALSPTFAPIVTPEATEMPIETPMPDGETESSEAVSVQPEVGSRYGIVVVEKTDGQWDSVKEYYFSSARLFVALCVVAVLIAILLFMVCVALVSKMRR